MKDLSIILMRKILDVTNKHHFFIETHLGFKRPKFGIFFFFNLIKPPFKHSTCRISKLSQCYIFQSSLYKYVILYIIFSLTV